MSFLNSIVTKGSLFGILAIFYHYYYSLRVRYGKLQCTNVRI